MQHNSYDACLDFKKAQELDPTVIPQKQAEEAQEQADKKIQKAQDFQKILEKN